jgi:hypothetical protein
MTRGPSRGETPGGSLDDHASPRREATGAHGSAVVRRFALDVLVFVAIVLIGVSRLPTPFTGDQALNMLMGRVIVHGGVPYVDLWDLKHPGIFFFFAAGGSLFGFTELGIHLFELCWMLTLGAAVRIVAGQYVRSRAAAALAPLLTVGYYYAVATPVHLTQTEALVGLPVLSSLLFASRGVRRDARRSAALLFASGLSAGVVAVFKAPYVLIALLFWVLALVEWRRTHGGGIRGAFTKVVPPALAGALVPASLTVAYLAQTHALGVAWRTFVIYPRQAAAETSLDLQLLRDATVWFVQAFAAPLALATVGAWDRLRRGWDLLTAALVGWVVVGAILIWAQVIGWWSYHYLLLVVPVGLLAAQGIETLVRSTEERSRRRYEWLAAVIGLAAVVVLVISPLDRAGDSLSGFLRARPLPLTADAARGFGVEHDAAYADALRTTSFLRASGSIPGPIYVFASPILYVLSDRPPAVAYLATWFDPTSEAWQEMMTELARARPPYIYVQDGALLSLAVRNPSLSDDMETLRAWLASGYRDLRTDAGGTWYIRRDLSSAG